MNILDTIIEGYSGYASYLWHEVTNPSWHNYFYWLIAVSAFFFVLEVVMPWRKQQPVLRKDFWLDAFYMFFNFFLFSLIIYNAASMVVVQLFNDGIVAVTGWDLQAANPLSSFPMWAILLIGFLVRDFVQWSIHRLLHRFEWLWQFHKVHHSVQQMGFAAHLRYHWMENIVYRSLEYIPLALLGIGLYDFFIIHIFTLAIGHYNHSNISVSGRVTAGILGVLISMAAWHGLADITFLVEASTVTKIIAVSLTVAGAVVLLGPFMKIVFNSPEMHIWHHAHDLPSDRRTGVNFGISLALWDYLWGTNYIPHDGRDIPLGFDGVEDFPDSFSEQIVYGIK